MFFKDTHLQRVNQPLPTVLFSLGLVLECLREVCRLPTPRPPCGSRPRALSERVLRLRPPGPGWRRDLLSAGFLFRPHGLCLWRGWRTRVCAPHGPWSLFFPCPCPWLGWPGGRLQYFVHGGHGRWRTSRVWRLVL